MLRVFFGQHKCASQWVTLVIERICNELGWKSVYAYEKVRTEHGGLRALINDENPDFLIIPESNVELVGEIDRPFQGFHVIRDPRDIVVSGYFSHKGSHLLSPAGVTMEHREKLQTLPKKAGMDLEIATLAQIPLSNIYKWDYHHPSILETKFMEITQAPLEEFTRIMVFMDMIEEKNDRLFGMKCFYNRLVKKAGMRAMRMRTEKYSVHQLESTLEQLSFGNLKKGKLKSLGQKTDHYRKGMSGDWRDHLTPQQEEEIDRLFPDIFTKLGFADQSEHVPTSTS
ncbi:MAG: sulfotransferase domain-containing protein [Flavobacteriales bacterium]|nr:sulfotransferase domain-containing protein [Flavobacteriales bacterium]MCB0758193.1 sulfotransferase domain-containing protein [Flavobacteriales bacterium]